MQLSSENAPCVTLTSSICSPTTSKGLNVLEWEQQRLDNTNSNNNNSTDDTRWNVWVNAGGSAAHTQKVKTRVWLCGNFKRRFYKCTNLHAQQHNWTLNSRCHSLSMTWQRMRVCRTPANWLWSQPPPFEMVLFLYLKCRRARTKTFIAGKSLLSIVDWRIKVNNSVQNINLIIKMKAAIIESTAVVVYILKGHSVWLPQSTNTS